MVGVLTVVSAAALTVLAATVNPAGAVGSLTLSQTTVAVASGSYTPLRVSWTGQPAGKPIFLIICVKPSADPTFTVGADCSSLSEVTANGSADGSGSAEIPVFRGAEPSGDNAWGCFADGDAVPSGILRAPTCYVRLTNDVVLNNDDAVEVGFTVTGAGDPVDRGPLGAPSAAPVAPAAAPSEPAAPTVPAGPVPLRFTG